jgi:hypothetical protein
MAVDMFDAIYNILCILLRHGPTTDQSSIVLLQMLESRALDVYRRPYLPVGQAEKTFLLLRALIASCPPDLLPRVPSNLKPVRHPSASNLPPLSNGTPTHGSTVACQLSKVLGTCMDELAAYAGKASAVLWEGAGMLAGVPGFQLKSHGMGPLGRGTFVLGGGHRALTGDAAATINRAVSDWVIVRFEGSNWASRVMLWRLISECQAGLPLATVILRKRYSVTQCQTGIVGMPYDNSGPAGDLRARGSCQSCSSPFLMHPVLAYPAELS